MRKNSRANKGQFFVIAALLVSVVLVGGVISTYSLVRNSTVTTSPDVLGAIGEMNTNIKSILDFTVGYYGSILQVTGNSSYARGLTSSYLSSGLVNIARSHPEWNPSFTVSSEAEISTSWFMPESSSRGEISVTYSLGALGLEGITYETSSALTVNTLASASGQAKISVMRDGSEPELGLTVNNFLFYNYSYADSTWTLVNPTNIVISANGVYIMDLPNGVGPNSYSVQIEDNRGIVVSAFYSPSSIESELGVPHYTYTFDWDSTGVSEIYDSLSTDNFVVEILQNGTLKWLGQPFEMDSTEPIPPISVKAFRVNATINDVDQQIPFQVEDWASDYMVPLGLSANDTLFSDTNMLVFMVDNEVSEVTLWWDGNDTATTSPFAWQNNFSGDVSDTSDITLSNGNIDLNVRITGETLVATSAAGSVSGDAEFLRINGESPVFGAGTSVVIADGSVRTILQQEPEYSGGAANCPNFYAQLYFTLPLNTNYYTYTSRLLFVESNPSLGRILTNLNVVEVDAFSGDALTENGTSGGYPVPDGSTGSYYDESSSTRDHHWSEFISGSSGTGVMFRDVDSNLYNFDNIIGSDTGAIDVEQTEYYPVTRSIEVNPVDLNSVDFDNSLDVSWSGAVVTFNDEPIHPTSGNVGLWVMVENPPTVSMDEEVSSPSEPTLDFFVDQLSDEDSSPDKGSHSDFSAQQDGPDSSVDVLTEATENDGGVEDYVDNNTSDVDSSEDIGSHSNFPTQQTGPDGFMDTLQEGNSAGASSEWFSPTGHENSGSWLNANWAYDNNDGTYAFTWVPRHDWSDYLVLTHDEISSNGLRYLIQRHTSDITQMEVDIYVNNEWTNVYSGSATWGSWEIMSFSQSSLTQIRFRFYNNSPDHLFYVLLYETDIQQSTTNYELNLEVQFTDVDDLLSNHELCIYTGDLGSEDINVDYWSGSSWQNVATDLNANSWNNFTISISSSTVTVRFSGGSETGDSSADQWQIDSVLINSYGRVEDPVDNNISDVDSSEDVGSHSDFSAVQSGPDSVFDTLSESNAGADPVIKVEHIQFDFGAGGSTTSVTDVGDLDNAFFKNNVARRTSAGPTGSSANINWNVFSAGAQLTNTDELAGYRATGQTATVRIMGEVWRYAGPVGGPNEFIVRWRGVVTIDSGSKISSQSISGISDTDKCVPFVQGVITNLNSRSDGNRVISHTHVDSSNNLVVERGETGTEIQVYVVVVEFTGSNWNVGHALGSSFSTGTNNVALFDCSDGTGNSFDVGDWHTAFIEASMSGGVSGDHALEDTGFVVEPRSGSTTGVTITFDSSAGLGGAEVFIHVIQNDNIYVTRYTDSQYIPSSDNHAVSGLTSLDESALEWYVFTDGTGTAYARGATGAYLTSTTNVAEWTHRTGNSGTYRFGVIDLSGLVDTNYEMDLEIQWTDIPYTLPNEVLAIFGGTMGDENLAVDVWTGIEWETVFSDLSSGWNNASITEWLTGSTFTIRFRGTAITGDSLSDDWEIDVALLHVWAERGNNYQIDLEEHWTNVGYEETNEQLCIYASQVGSENLQLQVWTGSAWETVISSLHTGWNNATVSLYLTSEEFTIRFVGSTETGDTTQDYWTIDATLLHTWS